MTIEFETADEVVAYIAGQSRPTHAFLDSLGDHVLVTLDALGEGWLCDLSRPRRLHRLEDIGDGWPYQPLVPAGSDS